MSCPCDTQIYIPKLNIQAGLERISRQIAGFPEFYKAMIGSIQKKDALGEWPVQGENDFGIMLLEMWAYICDSLAFYDEVIANELYLRTARNKTSVRKLTELLGYIPRNAVSAMVKLAVLAEGRQQVTLPKGMAFRSGAFEGKPPQVFELDTDTIIHPFFNSWKVESILPDVIGSANQSYFLIKQSIAIKSGDPLFIRASETDSQNQICITDSIVSYTYTDGTICSKVLLKSPASLQESTFFSKINISIPSETVALWPAANSIAIENSASDSYLTLNNVYTQIMQGDYILISLGGEYRWFLVSDINIKIVNTSSNTTITINQNTFQVPEISIPVSLIRLDKSLNDSSRKANGSRNWTDNDRSQIKVHFRLTHAGHVLPEPAMSLNKNYSLQLPAPVESPSDGKSTNRFLFQDKNQNGLEVKGYLDFVKGSLTLDPGTAVEPYLQFPLDIYGNVINASRGETVKGEILGSGDASVKNQSFILKKKPLAYLPSPTADNESGVVSTLDIYVDNILWKEVRSFFMIGSEQRVYIVRNNDEGETSVIFGDGRNGSRLPNGTDNVIANYRYGAGADSPPAGSISQIVKPVKGVKSIKNPFAAAGGADAETSDNLRSYAPGVALLLGRAVSIIDMKSVAAAVGGVRAVKAEWGWHNTKQQAVVQLWYIGEEGIEEIILQRLISVSDPTTIFSIEAAKSEAVILSIDIEIDPSYLEKKVRAQVRKTLADKKLGLLAPENIGIGTPLYRSRIFKRILSVSGVSAILSIHWNSTPFTAFALCADAGKYFDFEKGSILLNGKDKDDD